LTRFDSIAVLATVLCAQLVALGKEELAAPDSEEPAATAAAAADLVVFRLWGAAPWLAAAMAVAMAATLWTEGRRLARVQALRLIAKDLESRSDPQDQERALALLEAAARLAPSYANLRHELGQAHLEAFRQANARLDQGMNVAQAAALVLAVAPLPTAPLPQGWARPESITAGWSAATAEQRHEVARRHLVPGLRAYLEARDLCPLLAKPHIRIAANLPYAKQEPELVVVADDPLGTIEIGGARLGLRKVQELFDGNPERAAQSWHHSLEISDKLLPGMVELGQRALGPEVFLTQVLPDQPEVLVRAAELLFTGPGSMELRRPFLEKALRLLRDPQRELTADRWHVLARVDTSLGQPAEALEAYQAALERAPTQAGWRLEYAALLHASGRLAEARREVIDILRADPRQPQALELFQRIDRDLREVAPRVN
jgi:tetratricopeptide (TPR) repeat protein